ncbi:MAG TPA: hypothetical protein VGS57_19875 [Thermoanaerobaculia bacterium]|nr:hypothetical protein [Thermoanaerobaculia bacterium]
MSDANKPATPPRRAMRPAAPQAGVRPAVPPANVSTPPGAASAVTPAAASTTVGSRQQPAARPAAITGLADDLGAAGRKVLDQAVFGKRPYLRAAFMNPYNLSLLSGGLAASALTVNPVLALATLGLEAIWLLNAPDSQRLRHLLWDPRFDALRRRIETAEREQRMQGLPSQARQRVQELVDRREQIQRLAASNPSFAGDLLRGELVKTDKLVDAFLEMALTCQRYEQYLASVNDTQLSRDRQRYGDLAKQEGQGGAIARKNLAIVEKRIAKMEEIRRYLSVAYGQLDLIENSFQLIADQIVTMQSPQELSGQLDELLDGVEAIRETSRDTEQLLGAIEREM